MKNKSGMHKVVASNKFLLERGTLLDDSKTRKAPKASTLARRSRIAAREASKVKPAPMMAQAPVSTIAAQTDAVEIDTTAPVSETTAPAEIAEQVAE